MKRFISVALKYIQVICILLIFLVPVYRISYKTISNSVITETENALIDGLEKINNRIQKYSELASSITGEQNIKYLINQTNFSNESFYRMYMARQYLDNIAIVDELLQNYYILSNNNKIFLSRSLIAENNEKVYYDFYLYGEYTYDEWLQHIIPDNSMFYGTFFMLNTVSANTVFTPDIAKTKQDIVHLVVPQKRYLTSPKVSSTVVFMLSGKEIIKILAPSIIQNNSFVQVRDKDGNIIIDYNAPTSTTDYTLIKASNEDSGLSVTMGLPDRYFAEQTEPVMKLIIFYIVLGLFFAVGYSLLLSYKQSKPIQKVMHLLNSINPILIANEKDDFGYIEKAVLELKTKNDNFEKEMIHLNSITDTIIISKLLSGNVLTEFESEKCKSIIDIETEYYCVLVASYVNADLDLILQTIIEQNLDYPARFHMSEQGKITIILGLMPQTQSDLSDIRSALADITASLNSRSYQVFFGVGTIVFDMHQLHISYANANSALGYCDSEKPVVSYATESHNRNKLRELFSVTTSQNLNDLLMLNDYPRICDFFDEITKYRHVLKENDICQIFYMLSNAIMIVANQLNVKIELPDYYINQSLDFTVDTLKNSCKEICEIQKQKEEKKSKEINLQIINYINENYSNPLLSVYLLSEQFKLIPKYIFSIVRQETGKSLSEYIEHVRFMRTEKLLKTSEPINSISELVGFNNANTFYKAFKRKYGITPGEWRRINS